MGKNEKNGNNNSSTATKAALEYSEKYLEKRFLKQSEDLYAKSQKIFNFDNGSQSHYLSASNFEEIRRLKTNGKNLGNGLFSKAFVVKDIAEDSKKTGNLTYSVAKNTISSWVGNAVGKAAGLAVGGAMEVETAGIGTPLAVAAAAGTDIAVSSMVSAGVNKTFEFVYAEYKQNKKWIKYYDALARFKKLEPAKYDTNQPVAGVANSTGGSDNTQVVVTYPQAEVSNSGSNWLSTLGSILSGAASVISNGVSLLGGVTGNTTKNLTGEVGQLSGTVVLNNPLTIIGESFKINRKHTGGKVIPKHKGGRNEMIAILQGGETVRTEAQEKELQDANMKKLLEEYAPLVSGENNENNPYAQVFGNNKSNNKDVKIPVLANKTTRDEETIIAIIADAWKSNRSGFRNALRYS